MTGSILFQTIDSLQHPLLPSWLSLYETAFPAEERMLVAEIVERLQQREQGRPTGAELLAAADSSNALLGMAFYESFPQQRLVALWYMAVVSQARSQGLGLLIYRQVSEKAKAAQQQAMLFEVEIPSQAHTIEAKALAERRLGFYRRNGARLLQGIHYLQSVGSHQPIPTPMYIMVHPILPLTPEAAFILAKEIFGDNLQQTGVLSLSGDVGSE